MRALRGFGWVALGALALSGCHTYRPVQAAAPGTPLRVNVPVRTAFDAPGTFSQTAAIEGLLVSWGDTITLATQTRREYGAFREVFVYDTLRVAADQPSSVEIREFDSRRSAVLGVVIAGAAGLSAWYAFDTSRDPGQQPDDPRGEPQNAIISFSMLSDLWGLISR